MAAPHRHASIVASVCRLALKGWSADAIARVYPPLTRSEVRALLSSPLPRPPAPPAPPAARRPPRGPEPGRSIKGPLARAVSVRHLAGESADDIAGALMLEPETVRAFLARAFPPPRQPRERQPREPVRVAWSHLHGPEWRDDPAPPPAAAAELPDVGPQIPPALPAPSGDWGTLHGRRVGAYRDEPADDVGQVVRVEPPAIAAAELPDVGDRRRWDQPKGWVGRRPPADWRDD